MNWLTALLTGAMECHMDYRPFLDPALDAPYDSGRTFGQAVHWLLYGERYA